jgi:hypothetical protein
VHRVEGGAREHEIEAHDEPGDGEGDRRDEDEQQPAAEAEPVHAIR